MRVSVLLTLTACSEEGQRVTLDYEIIFRADLVERVLRQARLYLDDSMALCTGEVMMVGTAAHAVPTAAVCELDAVHDIGLDEPLDSSKYRSSTDLAVTGAKTLPELVQ